MNYNSDGSRRTKVIICPQCQGKGRICVNFEKQYNNPKDEKEWTHTVHKRRICSNCRSQGKIRVYV